MYFPYLRGRQFELIALREFAQEYKDNSKIIPIIEPVKKTFNSMKIALNIFNNCNQKYALILNPQVGDLINDKKINNSEIPFILQDALKVELENNLSFIPAFIVNDNLDEIIELISHHTKVMLICKEAIDSSDAKIVNLLLNPKVSYVIFNENRSLKKILKKESKELIRIDDKFKKQNNNYAYLNVKEEKFSEEHIYYNEENYYGFSDYTILPSEYSDGGWTPTAVSIHVTYMKENNEVWIKHFTSETYDRKSTNIQEKFFEACKKTISFFDEIGYYNFAIKELNRYLIDYKYPGLGTIKKLSIKNHLEIINEYLSEID